MQNSPQTILIWTRPNDMGSPEVVTFDLIYWFTHFIQSISRRFHSESSCLCRWMCGPSRKFSLSLFSTQDDQVLTFHRTCCRCDCCCCLDCILCLQKLYVVDCLGRTLGAVKQKLVNIFLNVFFLFCLLLLCGFPISFFVLLFLFYFLFACLSVFFPPFLRFKHIVFPVCVHQKQT